MPTFHKTPCHLWGLLNHRTGALITHAPWRPGAGRPMLYDTRADARVAAKGWCAKPVKVFLTHEVGR